MQMLCQSLNNKEDVYMFLVHMELSFSSIFDPQLFEFPVIEAADTEDKLYTSVDSFHFDKELSVCGL